MLQEQIKKKFSKTIALLGSNHDGERQAALEAANRLLESSQMSWTDIAGILNGGDSKTLTYHDTATACPSQAECYTMLKKIEKHTALMNEWSRSFVETVLRDYFAPGRERKLSENQRLSCRRIYTSVMRRAR